MTRRAYYRQQPLSGNGRDPRWTQESILRMTHLFVMEEGFFPSARYLNKAHHMPSYDMVKACFGTTPAYHAAYLARHPQGTLPRMPLAPRPPVMGAHIPCLRCGRFWDSPDKTQCRICPQCHCREDTADGLWLNGVAVVDAGWETDDWLMEDIA